MGCDLRSKDIYDASNSDKMVFLVTSFKLYFTHSLQERRIYLFIAHKYHHGMILMAYDIIFTDDKRIRFSEVYHELIFKM